MTPEKIIKTGFAGVLAGYRIHGRSFDTEGNETQEPHEEDCFCCKEELMASSKNTCPANQKPQSIKRNSVPPCRSDGLTRSGGR